MKKTIDFFKRLSVLPIIGLGVVYLFWLTTAPMAFFNGDETVGNFIAGLVLFSIFTLLSVGVNRLNKSGGLPFWIFISLLFPVFVVNIFYLMTFYPQVTAVQKVGVYKYYISSSLDWDVHGLTAFYKCKKWSLTCYRLYSSYGLSGAELFVDKTNSNVSLLNFDELLVTDGEPPKYYTGVSEQLGNKLYILSWDWIEGSDCGGYSCRKYIYTLNACNLDFTACNSLPIRYTETYNITPYWVTNEATKEISLYDDVEDEDVIFTYGEHPRCYANGCEILQESTSN